MQTQHKIQLRDRLKGIGFGRIGADKDRDTAGYRAKAAAFVEAGLKKVSDLPFLGQRRFEEKWLGAVAEKIREMNHNSN